jgi:coenzyme F420-dependent glucose-6-phosphate dehydrogenase
MAQLVSEEQVAESIVCGPDPEQHIKLIQSFADAGYDHVYVHQVGPKQEGFFRFYEREILPQFQPA